MIHSVGAGLLQEQNVLCAAELSLQPEMLNWEVIATQFANLTVSSELLGGIN